MNKLVFTRCFAASILALLAAPELARADQDAPGTVTIKTVTIYGRADKPHVEIILTRPTAANAAGAAHDGLRARLLSATEPHPIGNPPRH